MMQKKPTLGRGLADLLGQVSTPRPVHADLGTSAPPRAPGGDELAKLPLDLLQRGRYQPRLDMREDTLRELADSIKAQGVVQPIVVRPLNVPDTGESQRYEIIAGERRWRAAQRAGLLKVPIAVRDVPDDRLLAVALIENIQREDLNPIEEAVAYRRLADEFRLTQEQIADAVGKDRSSIANVVRLLRLPQEVRANVASSALSMGHARAILALPDEASQLRLARDVVSRGLSVRETEALAKKASAPEEKKPEKPADVHTRAAEEKLRLALGTRVRIVRKGKGGRVEIDFVNEDELQRIYERLTGE
jgi:ParB family transcriptional regulator, chromosome partitioning protein